MDEKIYRTMKGTGAMNIVLGIIAMVTGIVSGTLLIIGGREAAVRKIEDYFLILQGVFCAAAGEGSLFSRQQHGAPFDSSRSGFVNSFTGKTEEADGT